MPTLEQLLIDTRVLSPAQVSSAQRDANIRHKRLAATIVDLGMIDERRFAEWMSKITELPLVDPLPGGAIDQLYHRIAPQLAREYQVVPVAIELDTLTVATMNPLDSAALEILRHATGMRIRPVVAVYTALVEALSRFYPEDEADLTMMRRPPELTAALSNPNPPEQPPKKTESAIDRIERKVAELANAVEKLQRRVDAMDATIARALSRK